MPSISSIGNIPGLNQNVSETGNANLGKEDFLNLLVTQLRYQDPMEPLKDSDFVAQLAQFSSLEQLSSINTSLGYSSELDYLMSQTIANTMATTIIGKEVVADGNTIYHTPGSSSDLNFDLGGPASDVEVKVFNSDGALIKTINARNFEAGDNSVSWDGRNEDGSNVAEGEYYFEVSARNGAGDDINVVTRVVGLVESVRYEGGQGYLMIGGLRVSMSDIIQINMADIGGGNSNESEEEGGA